MEEKKETAVLCTCGGHCMHLGMKHHLIKKVLMIVAVFVVFCLGMQLGEIKGELRSFRGEHYGMMRNYGNDSGYNYNNDYRGPGMMGGFTNWAVPNTTQNTPTPATPATPAKP